MARKYVLCLHGYAMNPQWLQEWLAPVQQQITGDVEFVYPRAPIVVPSDEITRLMKSFGTAVPEHRIGENINWCWFRSTDSNPPVYCDIERSIEQLSALGDSLGHIDGVIGWSQGTVMAMVLIGQMLSEAEVKFNFKWAVLAGGFLPRDNRFQSYYERELSLPSLHVLGENEVDFMKQRGQKLYQSFRLADRLDTPVAHTLPVRHPEKMRAIAEWIQFQLNKN